MTSLQILSIYIGKLNHPLREIRDRALELLLAKFKLGWELDDELSSTRELMLALLNWFLTPNPLLTKEALDLLQLLIKTNPGNYITKELGIKKILSSIDQGKQYINEPEALEIYNDIIETVRFLNTLESEENVAIPALNLHSFASSESEENKGDFYSRGVLQSSEETSLAYQEASIKNNTWSKTYDGVKVLLFPWVDLASSDLKTMLLIEDALKLLKSVRRCCRFIRDVFLRDFPAEIFLNRPAIIKNLLAIAEGIHGNKPDEALQVLLCITKALQIRIRELSCTDLISDCSKHTDDQRDLDDSTNIELEQITKNHNLNLPCRVEPLAVLRQMPAPIFTLDGLHAVLTTMARNFASVDMANKTGTLSLKEMNLCLDLIESLIQLLQSCITKDFWRMDHNTKTYRDIAHKSCMVMRLLGDLLQKYSEAFSEESDSNFHQRAGWLRLLVNSESLLNWARDSALPPTSLVLALQAAQLDPAVCLLYPQVGDKIALVLQMAKISAAQEYNTKYGELTKLIASMEDAVNFIKNKNNCQSSKKVLMVIKKSLPALELHMSEIYLNDVANILLRRLKDFDVDNSDWTTARSIALSLMAHNVEWVRSMFYAKLEDMVKFVLVGDENNQTENEKCLAFICDVGILTEICCHGLSATNKQVRESATEVMVYLLRGRLVLSEAWWWRWLASLLPVLPLLHSYAEHDTQLGKAICKSLETDIASCMGVSLREVTGGLVRLVFVRCVAVQLDAAHSLCRILDDDKYLPPKEALRADVLLNALRRIQPQDFNIDTNSSPSKNPQNTGLYQILDVLKQDIILEEHGADYVSRQSTQLALEPSLRRSTLQQLAVMMRRQELHDAFLQSDGLKLVVAILRMSLLVDDYLAYPECAISCVSVLNSVCFASRHALAKVNDLPALLLRVIIVFPANDSAVLMSAQVLALIAWSGFALQELDEERRRLPALPACVIQRTALPFRATSYWNTSPNAGHSSVEWLTRDEDWRACIRVRWWCALEGPARVACGAPAPPAPAALRPVPRDRALLRASCPSHALSSALLALENATAHAQVVDALCLLESYVHLLPLTKISGEELAALPWQHIGRFLRAPPASSRDAALLVSLMQFILVYMDSVPREDANTSWIKKFFIDGDATMVSLLSRDQLLPQQSPSDAIEVTQLHIHIVKVLLRSVRSLEHEDYDSGKLQSLLKILLACLERVDLKNFHALGYLNELTRCIRHVLHSRYCKLSEDVLIHSMRVVGWILSGCACGAGRKGSACRLDAVLSLLALLRVLNEQAIPVQRWSELWHGDVTQAVVNCSRGASAQLRSASLQVMAALAQYTQLLPHLTQAIGEQSLSHWAAQTLAETTEASVVRAAAADLLTAVTARTSTHSDVIESEVLGSLKSNCILEHCLDVLVDFCNEREYKRCLESNVSLSTLERCSELEVRAQKSTGLVVSPVDPSVGRPPPTAALVSALADMVHNVSRFSRCPVQEWNDKGLYRLLFRCASTSIGGPVTAQRVRAAASRALAAVTSHACVRSALAATKDCLHNLLGTLTPLAEGEMSREYIDARAQGLLLLAGLFSDKGATCSLWSDFRNGQMTHLFCLLLQGLESDETELQAASLYCLTQLAQSIPHKKQVDELSNDESCALYLDSVKSPFEDCERQSAGDAGECHPEYIVEEMCKALIFLLRKESLEDKKFQCEPDDQWVCVSSCLSSLLSASGRCRSYAVHCGLPRTLLSALQAVRDHLSVIGKPMETIRNANHSPVLRCLLWILTLMSSSLVDCAPAKESFAENGIAVSLNRLWPWCMAAERLRAAGAGLLYNFTNDCPKAWSAMSTCVGSRTLVAEVCALSAREAALVSRTRAPTLVLLCVDTLRHCAAHHQCRSLILTSDVMSTLYKALVRDRNRGGGVTGAAWAKFCLAVARYADGAAALLALRPQLGALPPALRPLLVPALAHAAHHHRPAFLQSPELLELLCGTLLAGDTTEVISAARAVWALAANNHKAKLILRSAGMPAAAQAALQRVRRARHPAAPRALQLLAYTHSVLQAT